MLMADIDVHFLSLNWLPGVVTLAWSWGWFFAGAPGLAADSRWLGAFLVSRPDRIASVGSLKGTPAP